MWIEDLVEFSPALVLVLWFIFLSVPLLFILCGGSVSLGLLLWVLSFCFCWWSGNMAQTRMRTICMIRHCSVLQMAWGAIPNQVHDGIQKRELVRGMPW